MAFGMGMGMGYGGGMRKSEQMDMNYNFPSDRVKGSHVIISRGITSST